jgi:hypothetical protein
LKSCFSLFPKPILHAYVIINASKRLFFMHQFLCFRKNSLFPLLKHADTCIRLLDMDLLATIKVRSIYL